MPRPTFLTLPAEIHLSIFTFLTPPYSLSTDPSIRPASTPYNPLPHSSLKTLFHLLYALAPRASGVSQCPSMRLPDALSRCEKTYNLYIHYTHTLLLRSFRTILLHSQRATKELGARLIRSFLNKTVEDIVRTQVQLANNGAPVVAGTSERDEHIEVNFWDGFLTLWYEAMPTPEILEEREDGDGAGKARRKSREEKEQEIEDIWTLKKRGEDGGFVKDSGKVERVVERMAIKFKMRGLLKSILRRRIVREGVPVTDQLLEEMVGRELEKLE